MIDDWKEYAGTTMDCKVKHTGLDPLPIAKVIYEPESQVLFIENGQSSEVGEEMARDILVLYDKDVDEARTSAVAVRIDCAEAILKPFVDAILAKYGIKPVKGTPEFSGSASDD